MGVAPSPSARPYVPRPVPSEEELAPHPGGLRRFAIAVVVAALLLSGVVVGLIYWMKATQRQQTIGPQQLTYPDNRPFRRGQ